jgi:hypothetical protein
VSGKRPGTRQWSDGAAGPLLKLVPDAGWQDRAACRDVDPALFFPETGANGTEAKQICAGCAVRKPCLTFALDSRQEWGVWAGETFEGGRLIVRPVPKARAPRAPSPVVVSPQCLTGRHDRTDTNTRKLPGGGVRCLDCERDRCRRYRQSQREAA